MSIPILTLQTDKNVTSVDVDEITIRQSESGLSIIANLVSANGSAYDLTSCKVKFGENKDGGKMVDDDAVIISNAKAGQIKYILRPEVYQKSGNAWFEITDNSNKLIDTTTNFHIKVIEQANLNVGNENYWATMVSLLTHIQASADKAIATLNQTTADGQAKVTAMVNDSNKEISDAINSGTSKVNAAVKSFNATLETYKQQLATYQAKYDKLDSDWAAEIAKLDKSMQAEVDKTVKEAQNGFIAERNQMRTDFAKFESDLKTQLNADLSDLIAKINTLKTKTVPDLDAKVDAVQKKIDGLRADFDKIDLSTYIQEINGIKPVNNKLQLPMFAPNLLEDTSEQWSTLSKGSVATIGTFANPAVGSKYTAAADIDWVGSNTGDASAGIYVWCYDKSDSHTGGGKIDSPISVTADKGTSTTTLTIPANTVKLKVCIQNSSTMYDVQYRNVKLAKWQNDETPPDMTWLPNTADTDKEITNIKAKQTADEQTIAAKVDKTTYEKDKQTTAQQIAEAGKVKSATVNGGAKVLPDSTGNLPLKVTTTSVNGKSGSVQVPLASSNFYSGSNKIVAGKKEYGFYYSSGLNTMTMTDTLIFIADKSSKTVSGLIAGKPGTKISASVQFYTSGTTALSKYHITILFYNSSLTKLSSVDGNALSSSTDTSTISGVTVPTGTYAYALGVYPADTYTKSYFGYANIMLKEWRDANTPPDMTMPLDSDYAAALVSQSESDLTGRVNSLENREFTHDSGTDSAALSYSNSHKDVIVFGS